MRCAYYPGKFAFAVTFDLSTYAPQCPRANCFSNSNPLRVRRNPLGLRRRYLGQEQFRLCHDQFHEFHLSNAQFRAFRRTKRQPRRPELWKYICGQHRQSEFDVYQFRNEFSHDFPG
jgi:hypothetical protein